MHAPWQVRRSIHDEYDGYIVVSFNNATLVLSIGETVEEVNDSGFLGTVQTIRVQMLEDSSLVQVCRLSFARWWCNACVCGSMLVCKPPGQGSTVPRTSRLL